MPSFVLTHRHEPHECGPSFAAWKGFESPLRHRPTMASCMAGSHRAWWRVEAADADSALAHLPPFVAERSVVEEVREVKIP